MNVKIQKPGTVTGTGIVTGIQNQTRAQPNGGGKGAIIKRPKVTFIAVLSSLFLFTGAVRSVSAQATLKVKLPRLPRTVKPVLISVRALNAETSEVVAATYARRKITQVRLNVKAVPQIVFADLFTSDGENLSGHSPVLRPVDRKRLTVPLQLNPKTAADSGKATRRFEGAFSSFAGTAWPPAGVDLVGIKRSDFTAEGLDPLWATREAPVAITDLANTPCYDKPGGFILLDTDPVTLAIRKAEIDLSNSVWADPSTRLTDRYVPPGKSIHAHFASDGTNVTMTMQLVDSQGNVLLSKSATGPLDSWLEIRADAMNQLITDLCRPKDRWTGSTEFTRVDAPGLTEVLTTSVTFKLIEDLGSARDYEVENGSATWSFSGTASGCSFQGGPLTIGLKPDDGHLIIYTEDASPYTYYTGLGAVEFEANYTVTCLDQPPITLTVMVWAPWFNAPYESKLVVSGDGSTIIGEYSDTSFRITWNFTRTGF